MLNSVIRGILADEGVASFTTVGAGGRPHMAATWNSYIRIDGDDKLLIPAGSLSHTEENINNGSDVQMIIGSKSIQGMFGQGAGYLLKGTAIFEAEGSRFEEVKANFAWARAAMVLHVLEVKQLV